MEGGRTVRAPRGSELTCKGWNQEAAMRMLMNNLDPEVAERPDDLVVYGGTGRAARSWDAFDAIVSTLRRLENDETLLVQSGKPVGVFRTHEWSPRVLIANSLLVPEWANWDEFRRLEAEGLTMYGQMTAGSWIYIGTQGILQGTYETFRAIADKRFGGTLGGTITLTAGLGGMGGAQPLAITMNGGVALCVEVDPDHARRRLETRYLDEIASSLEDAIARIREPWDFCFFLRLDEDSLPKLKDLSAECKKLGKAVYPYFVVETAKNKKILERIGWAPSTTMEKAEEFAQKLEGIVDGIIATCLGDLEGDKRLLEVLQKVRG